MNKNHIKIPIVITCYVFFGLGAGLLIAWWDARFDTPLLLNLPGYYLGDLTGGLWVRFINKAAPWLIEYPRAFTVVSIIFWGITGAVFARFLKWKTIAWITGIYLAITGGLTMLYIYGI